MFVQKLVHLNTLSSAVDKYYKNLKSYCNDTEEYTLNCLAKIIDDETAKCIAIGKLDARSLTQRKILSDHWNNNEIKDIKKKAIKDKDYSIIANVVCFPHTYVFT